MPDEAKRSARLLLFGEMARGGMGAILKGRDPDLGRDLAVKVLLESHRDKPELVRRFIEEAQIGGQLQHPGVIPIYELGAFADRRPYFAMKLVKGRTLTEVLAERSDPAGDHPRLLAIFLDVAQTTAYAHARGVIHRDLKPSNIMVGSFGEVQVMDWGLAKVLPRGGATDDARAGQRKIDETVITTARSGSDSGDFSKAGSVLGTPSYMSPEQARGENDRLDERADVFALGSILCEILTGEPAFTGRSSAEILRLAARGDLSGAWKRLETCRADAELLALARDTLAPEADDRPPEAQAIVDRLSAYQAGVQARVRAAEMASVEAQARAEEEAKRRVLADRLSIEERRKRYVTLALAASILLTATLVGFGWIWAERGRAARAAAVDTALAEARLLQGQARLAPPEDSSSWAEALSAVKRAEGLLAGSNEPALSRRVEEMKGQIEADRRRADAIRKLVADLETVRADRAEHFEADRADREYAKAFLAYGLDLDSVDPKRASDKLAGTPATAEIAAAIDDWCAIRRINLGVSSWSRLVEVARAVDPDVWRNTLRDLYGKPAIQTHGILKAQAADAAALASQPAPSLILLAEMLARAGDREGSAEVLRAAWRRFPSDYWVNLDLGFSSRTSSSLDGGHYQRPDEAMRFCSAAVAIRPGSSHAFNLLGIALEQKGDVDGAITAFQEAVRLRPDISFFHSNLGLQLEKTKRIDEAIVEYRLALRMRPDNESAQSGLAVALKAKGQFDDAIIAYREAVQLKPDDPNAFSKLVNSLLAAQKYEEAIAVCQESIRVRPNFALAYHFLGMASNQRGRRTEEIAAGRIKAIAAWREAVRLDPNDRLVWYWLGVQLNVAGEFASSVQALRRAVEMKGEPIPADAGPILARTEAYARLEPRLPAVLRGEDRPKDTAETILFARMCNSLQRYAASVRLFEEAFAKDPTLADNPGAGRFYAARCAVLGGCVPGKDDPPLDEARRSHLRKQGLHWLRVELDKVKALVERGPESLPIPLRNPQTRADVLSERRRMLEGWKTSRDLIEVRDPEGLAKLPEAERKDWQPFWAEVDALILQTQEKKDQ
jgi:serine/threonine-protein kinase